MNIANLLVLLALVINGKTFAVLPIMPERQYNAVSIVQHEGTQIIIAHSYLGGQEFYLLSIGDKITARYAGMDRVYIVTSIVRLDRNYILDTDVPGTTYLVTCLTGNNGTGKVIGRLLIGFSLYSENNNRRQMDRYEQP